MSLLLVLGVVGLAVIYLLSRRRGTAKPDLSKDISHVQWRDALTALIPGGRPDPVWKEVITELLWRLGADRQTIGEVLRPLGFEQHPGPHASAREPDQGRPALRLEHGLDLQNALEKALVVGITLAAADDDYGHVGEPSQGNADADAMLNRRAEQIESAVFDTRDGAQYEFYAKALLVLQDMLQDTSDEAHKRRILGLSGYFEEQSEVLGQRMDAAISSLRGAGPPPDKSPWGDAADRQLYYFQMGVTNALRKHRAHFPSLDGLYRAKGLGYNVEEAYELLALESPTLNLARDIGIQRLLAYDFGHIRALVRATLPDR